MNRRLGTLAAVSFSALLSGASTRANAQPQDAGEDRVEEAQPPPEGFDFTGLPLVFYTPETSLGFGGAAVLTYRERDALPSDRPQNVTLTAAYTSRKQTVLILDPDFYFDRQRWQVGSTISLLDFPNRFYGVGGDTSEEAREDYTLREVAAESRVMRKVFGCVRVGLLHNVRWFDIRSPDAGGLLARSMVSGADGGWTSGLGPVLDCDHRDSVFYPTDGGWYRAEAAFHDEVLGSSFRHAVYRLDLRRYVGLGGDWVLALQIAGEHVRGDVPFDRLPSPQIRGIFAGRFRDRNQVTTQTELRFPLFRRLSSVAFVAVGDVAPRLDGLTFADPKWGAGGGLRFALLPKEKLNVRFDLAYSPWGFEPYFQLREAF